MSRLKAETMKHYDRLAACRNWGDFMLEGWGGQSCILCVHYQVEKRVIACAGCPVQRATGAPACLRTPWDAMDDAIENQSRSAMPLIEPLPEVLAMKEFLESLDWEGQP